MNSLLAFWTAIYFGALVYALLTVPTWFSSSINRGCLWRLRDTVFDDRRTGKLPDSDDVQELLSQIEMLIVVAPSVSAAQMWWVERQHLRRSGAPENTRDMTLRLTDGTDEQRALFAISQVTLSRIVTRQYLTGSWSGLIFEAPRNLTALWHTMSPSPASRKDVSAHQQAR